MRILVALLIVTTSAISVYAQPHTLSTTKDTRAHADKVADLFSTGRYTAAFEEVRKIWHFPMQEIDELESKTKESMSSVLDRYGNTTGVEFVRETKAATSLIRYTYLVRCGFHPIHVRITYYRAAKGWILNSFVWNDEVGQLLGE